MRVYNGWVLRIGYVDFVVAGSQKLRGVQSYVLRATHGVRRISRPALLAGLHDGSIQYVNSIAS